MGVFGGSALLHGIVVGDFSSVAAGGLQWYGYIWRNRPSWGMDDMHLIIVVTLRARSSYGYSLGMGGMPGAGLAGPPTAQWSFTSSNCLFQRFAYSRLWWLSFTPVSWWLRAPPSL